MTSKTDKLPLETEPVARDNTTILTLKPGDQNLSRLAQLIIVVISVPVSIATEHAMSSLLAFVRIRKLKNYVKPEDY